jgi:hypothetical protein
MSEIKLKFRNAEDRIKELLTDANKSIFENIIEVEMPSLDIDISEAYNASTFTLGEYTTLDFVHIGDIKTLMKTINDYSKDSSKKRPLNIIMQAEPGSGKSHFIKCSP